ncbi:adenylosuccinate lyase [Streptomyces sp. NPDC002766]|uniref:adenylosuccinate lyase n=1 Tax=Streptomyces sp. NPDC002766 TaxID=3154429 RepID=UPI003319C1B9
MIPRYVLPAMADLWSDESKYTLWARIEVLVAEAQAAHGVVPAEALRVISEAPPPAPQRVAELERTRDHEILAFLAAYTETMPVDAARWVHHGLTSYDVVDTALGSTLKASCGLVLSAGAELLSVLAERALEHWDTVCVGRTHGVHAEPTTFGQKLAVHAFAVRRSLARIRAARTAVMVGTVSGAVGTYAFVDPRVEAYVCQALGLTPESVPSQVVARDRHAELLSALAVGGAVVEQIALELRHLQRTEVREVEEPRTSEYQGSSAMPHKRNPSTSERLCGLARLLRAHAGAALEDVALWHERDLAHQAVERVILPDSLMVAHFQLASTAAVIRGLTVRADRMRENLNATRGLIYSSMSYLDLVSSGMERELAYRVVQSAATEAWSGAADFAQTLRSRGIEPPAAVGPERYLAQRAHLKDRLQELIKETAAHVEV